MDVVARDEIYEAYLDPVKGSEQSGQRPVLIVSRDSLNEVLDTVVVIPLTTLRPGRPVFPTQGVVRVPEGGVGVDSVVQCEQVRAISRQRLLRCRGAVTPETLRSIEQSLRIALDLD